MEQPYMDEKWKLSRKGSRNNGSRRVYTGDASTSAASTAGTAFFRRSESAREPSTAFFRRSESVREPRSSGSGGGSRSSNQSLPSRCASLVKEQRARFYIVRRCVTMLVCWKDR